MLPSGDSQQNKCQYKNTVSTSAKVPPANLIKCSSSISYAAALLKLFYILICLVLTVAALGLDQNLTNTDLESWALWCPLSFLLSLVLRFNRRKQKQKQRWRTALWSSLDRNTRQQHHLAGVEENSRCYYSRYYSGYFGESRREEGSHRDHQDTANAAFCRNGKVRNHIIPLLLANSTVFCALIQQFSHLGGRGFSVYKLDKCGGMEPPRRGHDEGMCRSAPCTRPPSVLSPLSTRQPLPRRRGDAEAKAWRSIRGDLRPIWSLQLCFFFQTVAGN